MKSQHCFICKSVSFEQYFDQPNFSLRRCPNCDLVQTIKTGHFELNDDQYIDPTEPTRQFTTKRNIYEPAARSLLALLKSHTKLTKGKRLLDIGCGLGWIVREAQRVGYISFGIDSSKTFVTQGEKLLKVHTQVSSLEEFHTDELFDVIVLSHVIEHIAKLPSFLKKVRTFLKKDGKLLIACPNRDSLMFHFYKERWYALAPGQHLWQFSKKNVQKLLTQNGFDVDVCMSNNLYHEVSGWRDFPRSVILLTAPLIDKGDQLICIATKSDS